MTAKQIGTWFIGGIILVLCLVLAGEEAEKIELTDKFTKETIILPIIFSISRVH